MKTRDFQVAQSVACCQITIIADQMWVMPRLAMVALKEFLLQQKEEKKLQNPAKVGVRPKWSGPRKEVSQPANAKRGGKNPTTGGGGEVKRVLRYTKNYPNPVPRVKPRTRTAQD